MMIKLLGMHPNTVYEAAEKILGKCSYRGPSESVDIVRKLANGTPCSMMIEDVVTTQDWQDWDTFCKTFKFDTIIPVKTEPPSALKLFRGIVPPKKNTGKNGKINGRQGIEILVLAFDGDEAFGYMQDYVKSLGQLFNHVRPEDILYLEVVGPFKSGHVIAGFPHPNG